ncbi:MAG: GNAT family N-acetyltransferase [Betaproteobacteria bacterium]
MKSSEVLIRRLTSADAPAYRALRLRGFREHPQAFTTSVEEESLKPLANAAQRLGDDSSCCFWGAFVDNTLVGLVGLERENRAKLRHKGLIIGLFVAPEVARRGIARTLLRTLLAQARESGLERLALSVTRGNLAAEKLYLDMGFRSWGVEPGAIQLGAQRFDKNHLFLNIKAP